MWVQRKVLRVKRYDQRSNGWIRAELGIIIGNELLCSVKRRKLNKYCHWKHRPNSSALRTVEYGLPGPNNIGRLRVNWMSNIIQWTDGGLTSLNECARRKRP